jgi:CO/xanthine dehydrogenase FAD-binding subunit
LKPAPFEYSRPSTVDEACALLAADEGARIIAGGQTLVPMMAMRLARPTRLVDIARLAELSFVRHEDSSLAIGAVTRQSVLERHPLVASHVPLLAKALPWVGHAATRARGTIGGSLANADPAAEISLVAAALDATLFYRVGVEHAKLAAAEFFIGPMMTALHGGACLLRVAFPLWEGRVGTSFHEVSARRSDFAFASAAVQLALDPDGACRRAAIAIGAATDVPVRLRGAEQTLAGTRMSKESIAAAIHDSIADVETSSDLHASAAYRRRAATTLAIRAVTDAHDEAMSRHAH